MSVWVSVTKAECKEMGDTELLEHIKYCTDFVMNTDEMTDIDEYHATVTSLNNAEKVAKERGLDLQG